MYGNLLSNKQIEQYVHGPDKFTIHPYKRDRLKLAHYKLSAGFIAKPGILREDGTRRHKTVGHLSDGPYVFEPRQYLIVQLRETILLPEGIVGNFVPASTLVEQGFALTAGKLDSGYGELDGQEQHVLVGLTNLLDEPNPFDSSLGICHIYFADFRGTERFNVDFTAAERQDFRDRRLGDDGPNYHADDPE